MAAKILMVVSASIIFTLGVLHLVYTFWGPKLTPRDPALQISMSQISPVITNETTMWRCWVPVASGAAFKGIPYARAPVGELRWQDEITSLTSAGAEPERLFNS